MSVHIVVPNICAKVNYHVHTENMSNFLRPVQDVCIAYYELQERVSQMISKQPDSIASLEVPHCPKWIVRSVISHMVGVPEDVLSGQMDGVTTEAWTQRQVDRHSAQNMSELLAIWHSTVENFRSLLPNIPQPTISQFVFDQVTHEHDIRHAISQPGARDSQAIAVAEGFVRDFLSRNQDPRIAMLANSRVSGFDFVRSLSGRRSAAQIAEVGLPAEVVVAFISTSIFDLPAGNVVE
ncbi:MAG: hypothetical protein NTY54_09580 [Actinobacteria bacterium]|nr:hypothetical protein [Actinomycetota bacterium]